MSSPFSASLPVFLAALAEYLPCSAMTEAKHSLSAKSREGQKDGNAIFSLRMRTAAPEQSWNRAVRTSARHFHGHGCKQTGSKESVLPATRTHTRHLSFGFYKLNEGSLDSSVRLLLRRLQWAVISQITQNMQKRCSLLNSTYKNYAAFGEGKTI